MKKNKFLYLHVVAALYGGLGNQMFQYAAGRALSLRLNASLQLDLTWFDNMEGCTPRTYQLSCFPIKATLASKKTLGTIFPAKQTFLQKIINKFHTVNTRPQVHIFHEPHFQYTPEFEKLTAPVYLSGYWQSEKYFLNSSEFIFSDFEFPPLPSGQATNIANKILSNENSVSIHVRRGDYVKDRKTSNFHGICSVDYYTKAIKELSTVIKNPSLFLFSDDPEWVQSNFNTHGYPHTIVHLSIENQPWHDMHLMSLCRHHIIANSSFSWWGTWLAKEPGYVFAPHAWFAAKEKQFDNPCKASWTRI